MVMGTTRSLDNDDDEGGEVEEEMDEVVLTEAGTAHPSALQ